MSTRKISTRRNPRSRFDEDKPMRLRVRVGDLPRGAPVPKTIRGGKLRRWWNANLIERADIPEKWEVEQPVVERIVPIRNSGWFLVKWSNRDDEKIPRSRLEQMVKDNPALVDKISPFEEDEPKTDKEVFTVTFSDGRVENLTRAQMVEQGIEVPPEKKE